MKARIYLIAFCIGILCTVGMAQSVVVTTKKVTYTRPKPIVDFKKTFTVNYPKVRAANRTISAKIESALSYEKVFGVDIAEEQNDTQWLEDADFEVVYNRNGLLSVALSIGGTGAYPDGSTKHIVVDTRTGNRVLPGEVFVYTGGLVDKLNQMQKKEIAAAIKEIKANRDYEEPNPEQLFETANFRVDNLKGFSISAKGVTFYYDYGFPHVIQALAPDGTYMLTWAELKPYIRVNGALGRMTR